MKMGYYKKRCHALMDEIWGDDIGAAYTWLRRRFGGDIHFSTLHNEDLLRIIYEELSIIVAPKERKGEKKYQTLKIAPSSKKNKKRKYETASVSKELLREVGRRNTLKVMPWYKRISSYLSPLV